MFNSIEEAIKEIKNGKIIIVVDNEDRENEGDFVVAAELITPEIINFMSRQGRGLICAPIPENRCDDLELELMVDNNTDPNETAFTVSIDLIGNGVSTGISASDRSKTIRAMMNSSTKPSDFAKPGHIFPLKAKIEGVLRRPGHTEAAVDLTRLAGLNPGGVIVEIMNEEGNMARLPELLEISKKFKIKIISIKDLIEYRLKKDSLIEQIESFNTSTIFGNFEFIVFRQKFNKQIHFALKKGNWTIKDEVLVRVISSSLFNNLFYSLVHGEKLNLEKITKLIHEEGKGVIIFINNIIHSETVSRNIHQFKKYSNKKSLNPLLPVDEKDLGIGIQIIKNLGITNMKLISNRTKKIPLKAFGLKIKEYINLF